MDATTSLLPNVARMDSKQLSHLYHLIFTTDVSSEIVKESIEAVCGRGVEIARDTQITPVLQEVINRQVLEENAYWDFRAMVVNERQTLSPADTLLFMRVLHGDNFSTAHWNKFMDSRLDRGADVSWAEVKPWVCRIPDERDLLDNGYKEVESEVQQEESRRNEESLRRYTDSNKRKHAKEMFLHTQKVKKQAQNKVNLWEQEGIAAFLADEPEGHYIDASKWMNKDRVVTTDVLDLLEEKYTRLRQKLLTLMATRFSGETTWEILSDRDRHELVEEMVMEERRLRLSGVLPAQSRDLLGATFTSDENFRSIAALMGEVYERQKEGSQSNQVVVGEDYWRKMAEVQDTFGQYLIDLMSRYEQELALYKSNLRCEKERKTRNEVIYCQLQRQLLVIDSREKFEMAALAVGVTERTSKNSHREVDRKRQEALASVQLSSHVDARGSKHAIASASMTTSELNSLGDRELYLLIIKQIQTKHNAESRRMGSLLHQRSSRSQKSAPTTLMKDEVIRQLTVLSNQRATWREANDKYKEMQKDDHRRILQNALAIYYESEARQAFPDYKTHAKMNAGILALLYKKQGEEFDKLIDELSRKQKMGLIEVLKREEQDTVHEHCNNIAALLFGSVESGEVDKLYVEQLGLKYLGYRHQIVQYSLSKKFGDSWYSRPVEDQQRHIAKLAITLKELLDQGKVDEMDAAVAETTQHISMYQCLGENRLQFEKRISSGQPNGDETVPSEPGVFGSLSSRYFSEYAAVLEAAHKAGDTEPRVLLALLKAETFIVEQSNDMRIALFLTGLIERVGGVLGKRHSADLIRIGNLAKCLVANHRLVWRMQGKHPKVNSDVYCNNTSSPTQWLEGLLKELLCKHWDERDTLLKIVLDEGLRELREVADCQSKEDQHRRLVALQNMQRWLDFDSPDARDENIAILEEAAAIQMCMVCETLVKANQPADVDSIAVVLTEKLLGKQEKELAYLLKEIKTMGVEDMMRMHGEQTEARQTDRCKNVAKVLTSYTGIWTDARIISEVDTKYSMLEKLMLESRLRLSEPQWDTMDSTRKDQLLAELKAQTERHRVAGNFTESLRSLYAPLFPDDQKFFSLFGENSFEFAHKIVDFQNVDNLPNDIYSVAEEIVPVVDPVAALRLRKDEEKQAYQNLLRGMYGVFLGDQGRAAEVIKLRHHQSMIKSSSDFANIALQLGFKERSQLVTYLTKGSGDHKMLCTGDWERIVAVSTKAIEDGDVTMEDISAISGASSAASKLFVSN
ncbi:uncharacterized protein [Watersipora subatra]|uniref:uncharacterized protein n=1 Tax=Watersipora subatra TaxID=2589382 RepID=UPI00355BF99B